MSIPFDAFTQVNNGRADSVWFQDIVGSCLAT